MRIEDVVNVYDNNKLEQAKEYFANLLGSDYEVRLRVLDPRVNHYQCYGEVNDEVYQKIINIYPNAKKEYDENGILSIVVGGKIGFSIYNVTGTDREKLIAQHDEKYAKKLEDSKNIIY